MIGCEKRSSKIGKKRSSNIGKMGKMSNIGKIGWRESRAAEDEPEDEPAALVNVVLRLSVVIGMSCGY